MAALARLVRASRSNRTILLSKTLNPSSRVSLSDHLPPLFLLGASLNRQIHSNTSEIELSRLCFNANSNGCSSSMFPAAAIASFFGAGMFQVAYADSDQSASKASLPAESSASSSSNYDELEEIAKKERRRIEELLESKGSSARFAVAVKGQKVTIKFQIPPACDIPRLIANVVSNLGVKVDEQVAGSYMSLRAWDSSVAWQLTLNYPEKQKEIEGEKQHLGDTNTPDGDLCILFYRSLISSDKAEIEFIKSGRLSTTEIEAFVSALLLAGTKSKTVDRKSPSVSSLESMGVRIYGLDDPRVNSSNNEIEWENIAGYDQQKREIEDTILLALQSPEVYDDIARGTRRKYESNRPRAVLFEGPPGTGKTSCARVIAAQAGVPLLYVPLEVVMSKYYGESERLLGKVFSLANKLPNGSIIFLDEVDSFAAARDSEMHEATRRILSVLLRQIDGFEQDMKVVVIAATNRKQDLDPALISRFDSMITFGLPDRQNRQEIAAQYAKHLTKSELEELARVTEDMSGRDIRDVCQQAERSWASKIIRGLAGKDGGQGSLPPLTEYIESAMIRGKALASIAEKRLQGPVMRSRIPQLDTF